MRVKFSHMGELGELHCISVILLWTVPQLTHSADTCLNWNIGESDLLKSYSSTELTGFLIVEAFWDVGFYEVPLRLWQVALSQGQIVVHILSPGGVRELGNAFPVSYQQLMAPKPGSIVFAGSRCIQSRLICCQTRIGKLIQWQRNNYRVWDGEDVFLELEQDRPISLQEILRRKHRNISCPANCRLGILQKCNQA